MQFTGICWVALESLGLSQIYISKTKLRQVETWLNPQDLSNLSPLPVHDFGNGRLTLTDGHTRAFALWRAGVKTVPVAYDLDDMITCALGQLLYKNDIVWCERFGLTSIADLQNRVVCEADYAKLWNERCDVAYELLTQTTPAQREIWQAQHKGLFLYGISQDLHTLFFEDATGHGFPFPSGL